MIRSPQSKSDENTSTMEAAMQTAMEQEQLGKELLTILTNAKKDGAQRRTREWLENKKKRIEEVWQAIEVNHKKIERSKIDVSHSYIRTNYYGQLTALYEDAITYFTECNSKIAAQEEKKKTPLERNEDIQNRLSSCGTSIDEEQKIRIRKQMIRCEQMNTILQTISSELTMNKYVQRYEMLLKKANKQWESVSDLHEEIMAREESFEDKYFRGEYEVLQEKVEEITEEIHKKIVELQQSPMEYSRQCNLPNVSLPKINIPKFKGRYQDWPTFHDLYKKIIHENESLSKVEKMQYLKTNIQGEAGRLIQHLQINEDNYETSWELLKKRYDNKRLTISKLIDRLLDAPQIETESAFKLRELYDTVQECLETIRNNLIDTSTWGPIVSRLITRKWDKETNKIYEQSLKNPHELQNFQDQMEFLEKRFQSLEATSGEQRKDTYISPIKAIDQKATKNCICCDQAGHIIYTCKKFKNMNVNERYQLIKQKQLCTNCLTHSKNETCVSKFKCKECNKPHNYLLHNAQLENKEVKTREVRNNHVGNSEKTVLLATAIIKVKRHDQSKETLRALIDSGSQASFVTEETAQLLGLPRQKVDAEVTGIGDSNKLKIKHQLELEIEPKHPSNFKLFTKVMVIPKITGNSPQQEIERSTNAWENCMLADPTYNAPGPVDILLGAEEYAQIVTNGIQKNNGLVGQNTELGWIISGNAQIEEVAKIQIRSMVSRAEQDKQLTRFWEIEEVNNQADMPQEEEVCEQLYKKTTTRNNEGKYVVQIPFKESNIELGESKQKAVARFLQLEKRFKKEPALKKQYVEFINEYINLGHMRRVPKNELNIGKYYIPHQPVIRESSTTTKLRVVFDASSKSSNGVSLNETMHIGPKLQQDLMEILIRWRTYAVAITADIEKMYRQILVHPDQWKFQRIIWRKDAAEPIEEFELQTVTYGTAAAPFLAIRTLQQISIDEENENPEAANIISRDFYVDDLLTGAHTADEAIKIQQELSNTLKKSGLNLRKWSSNNKNVLEAIPDELKDPTTMEIDKQNTKKLLGLDWNPSNDSFRFMVTISQHKRWTKRMILSEIAKIFDPLGWLSPIIISTKMLMQELWKLQTKWDEEPNEEIAKSWKNIYDQLKLVEEITIPRWIQKNRDDMMELHGFCDASQKAYGAVIYARICHKNDQKISVTLVTAKSKVAPIKNEISLPRLELCAASLLANLMEKTRKAFGIDNREMYYWSDSMVTLSWIKGEPHRWKTFVANKVTEIRKLSLPNQWHHVSTGENPADIISRGIEPKKLKTFDLWWHGPKWLSDKEIMYKEDIIQRNTGEEKIRCLQGICHADKETIIERFSNYNRMLRTISYCLRWKQNEIQKGSLTVEELNEALIKIVQLTQQKEFENEINGLRKNKTVERKSKLANLNPFLDDKNILRVGGRLHNSMLTFDEKHPIILSAQSHLSKLIIDNAHKSTLHGGNQLTLAYIRKKFWIIQAKKAVRSNIHKCVVCTRFNAQTAQQLMGSLPSPRVTPAYPFVHTGVDYAGPIAVRATKGRGHKSYKGYIAIFVCLVTKAVHLELAGDMTTETFLAVLRRFISRRGHCSHIYSDNGTNFVGAKNIIESEMKQIMENKIVEDEIATWNIKWHFIPPATPHFGGLWEAGVKSTKYHLKRVIGEHTLTFEELTTLLCHIEACLNSRPIIPLTNDADDLHVLTPGHFIIGRNMSTPLDYNLGETTESSIANRWKLLQRMKSQFWKAWSNDYLNTLQQRFKWKNITDNITEGSIILLKENISPNKWPLARVVQVHPGRDGLIRAVTINTGKGTKMKRGITNIIPLPNSRQENQEDKNQEKAKVIVPKSVALISILMLCTLIVPSQATYTVHVPKPGMYIEHLGNAEIKRGNFRIDIELNKTAMNEQVEAISQIILKFEKLCHDSKKLLKSELCGSSIHHLKELQKHAKRLHNSFDRRRSKRGILGKLLTYIFGVNDEIYKDLDTLDKNQKEIIKTTNHQNKIMLKTVSQFKDTEERINKQLANFREKIDTSLKKVNTVGKWFIYVDENESKINILSSYNIAMNYIKEVIEYFKSIGGVSYNKMEFYNLITPHQVREIMNEAERKIPSHLSISEKLLKTSMNATEEKIFVSGYFALVEESEYTLIKITPIPFNLTQNTYLEMEISDPFLAINHLSQMYFKVNEKQLRNSPRNQDGKYMYEPEIIYKIDTHRLCVIDEIYEKTGRTSCPIKKKTYSSKINWVKLYAQNAWLFTSRTQEDIAIICNNERENLKINKVGILQIDNGCAVHTEDRILANQQDTEVRAIGSFHKYVIPTFLRYNHSEVEQNQDMSSTDKVTNHFIESLHEEEEINSAFNDMHWGTIRHHSTLTSVITTVTTIVVIAIIIAVTWKIIQWKKSSVPTQPRKNESTTDVTTAEPIELTPLYHTH